MAGVSALKRAWQNLEISTDSSEPKYKRRNVSAPRDFPGDSDPVSGGDGSEYDPSEEDEVTVGSNGSGDDENDESRGTKFVGSNGSEEDEDDESWGTKFVGFEIEMPKGVKFGDSFNWLDGFLAGYPVLVEGEGGLALLKPKYKRRHVSARRDLPVGHRGSSGVVGGDESDDEPSEESMVGSEDECSVAANPQTDYFDRLVVKLDHMVADVLQHIMKKKKKMMASCQLKS